MHSAQIRVGRSLRLPSRHVIITAGVLLSSGWVVAQTSPPQIVKPTNPVQARAAKGTADWAGLGRYREQNAKLAPPAEGENRVVFMGDSITDAWNGKQPEFFLNNSHVCRGISGQTTPQMLIRFRPDVIALKPKVVVILAGTNDLAGNTGPITPEETLGNLISMTELAKANGIRVVLSSILPATVFQWRKEVGNPAESIIALNAMIEDYAKKHDCVYLDYYSVMHNEEKGLKQEYAQDSVHPNLAGYQVMAPLAEKAIAKALQNH
jgi:lysophospholipase L1-like esterase